MDIPYEDLSLYWVPKQVPWIQNILEGKEERSRVIYTDPYPSTGFTLIFGVDIQNEGNETFSCIAIPRKQICVLRFLNTEHIPLLEKIQNVGKEKLSQKFNIGTNQIHAYLHYRFDTPHLLIHFSHVELKDYTGKLINLSQVIQNIKFKSDYYAKAVLETVLEEIADDTIKAQITTDMQKANLKSLKPFKPIKILQRDDKKKELS